MPNQDLISRWLASFPDLTELDEAHRGELLGATQFNRLRGGDIAYRQGQTCQNYVMCIEGQTRVFKTSESGREILLYQVGPGETCVLTTSCLMAGSPFPAESTAETDVLLAALPASTFHRLMGASPRFRKFVLDNYGDLLSSLITLVDEVAFASLDLRLARRLLAEANPQGVVAKTHQQLARGDQPLPRRVGAHGLGARLARLDRGDEPLGAGKLWRRRRAVTLGSEK
jgi:CRP/FNR family transcriptional regulator